MTVQCAISTGNSALRQDMAGRAAENHLPQPALGVGALDQEIAAFRLGRAQDRLAGAAALQADRHRLGRDAVAQQILEKLLGRSGPAPPARR